LDNHPTNLPKDDLWEKTGVVPVILLPFVEKRTDEEGLKLIVQERVLPDVAEGGKYEIDADRIVCQTVTSDIVSEHGCLYLDARSFAIPINPVVHNGKVPGNHILDPKGTIQDGIIRNQKRFGFSDEDPIITGIHHILVDVTSDTVKDHDPDCICRRCTLNGEPLELDIGFIDEDDVRFISPQDGRGLRLLTKKDNGFIDHQVFRVRSRVYKDGIPFGGVIDGILYLRVIPWFAATDI